MKDQNPLHWETSEGGRRNPPAKGKTEGNGSINLDVGQGNRLSCGAPLSRPRSKNPRGWKLQTDCSHTVWVCAALEGKGLGGSCRPGQKDGRNGNSGRLLRAFCVPSPAISALPALHLCRNAGTQARRSPLHPVSPSWLVGDDGKSRYALTPRYGLHCGWTWERNRKKTEAPAENVLVTVAKLAGYTGWTGEPNSGTTARPTTALGDGDLHAIHRRGS